MDLITVDFETFYDQDFSLSKLTTEEYIRDPQFEVIGLGIKVNNGETEWASGTPEQVEKFLRGYDWESSAVLAHNTMFDGAILSWCFDIRPKLWLDTLCMGRALHGVEVGGSLKAMAERYGIGEKGTEVLNAKGKRRGDFTADELGRYGDYCVNDVDLTYKLFRLMGKGFPKTELKLIDLTLRMFIEPKLDLDLLLLEQHLYQVKQRKEELLASVGVNKKELMSNPKFAQLLRDLGVEPPMKTSLTTGKQTYAFAKSDEEFKALQEHEDDRVQALVTARLGTKSTLEETRTQRFIDIAKRGLLPVPVRYYAAHTGRWGGDDKINMQNLPSRGPNAKKLKGSIIAPPGHLLIDADSSQIEARVLAWLAGQKDLVQAFFNKDDVYKQMASRIYGRDVDEITKDERFVGKTTILGCIAEGTPVLSDSGWKPIEQVSISDKLWDGEEWVCHRGLVPKGMKETWSLCGSWLTPDHKILCGTEWKETQSVVQGENTLYQALVTGQGKLPSQVSYVASGAAFSPSLSNVIAKMRNTQSTGTTSKISKPHDVQSVLGKRGEKSGIGNTLAQCLTMPIELDSLTGYLRQLLVAITPSQNTTYITGNGALAFTSHGEKTEQFSLTTSRHWMDGITQSSRWIGSTTTKAMNPTIFGSLQGVITCGTNVKSQTSKRLLQTYDLAYAGPRNRFTILTEAGPVIAHNCGYGMGALKFQAQLKTFGYDMALRECRRVIEVYRDTNWRISEFWREAQFVISRLTQGRGAKLGPEGVLEVVPSETAIRLPSGLLMRYDDLQGEEVNDKVEYSYKTRKDRTRIYGGKVTENVCQAVARCIIGEQMLRISKRYRVVLTVHDSIVCCVPEHEVDEAQAYVEACMRWVPDWANGLPIDCESGTGTSYGECG